MQLAPISEYLVPRGAAGESGRWLLAAHIPMLMRENLTYLHSNLFAYKHKTTFAEQWADTHTHTHVNVSVCVRRIC